jgi:hypothetical protein
MSERAALVEQVAVDALRRAEQTEEDLLALGIETETADEAIVRGTIPAALEALPDDCVFLLPEATQAIRDTNVYSDTYSRAVNAGVVRWRDFLMACQSERQSVNWSVLDDGPRYMGGWTRPSNDGPGFRTRAELESALERAAAELALEARDRQTFALVRQVCEATLRDKGLSFFEDNYVALWAKFTRSKGIVWKSYYYRRGEGPAYARGGT